MVPDPPHPRPDYVCPEWCIAAHPRAGADHEHLIHELAAWGTDPLSPRIEAYRSAPPVLVLAGIEVTTVDAARALLASLGRAVLVFEVLADA